MSGSFLKKLERAADPTNNERTFYRGQDLESAVVDHIQRMLNTRAGSALTVPDYGSIELSELLNDFPEALGMMQRAIKNAILKYEPRLKNVQVRPIQPDEDQTQIVVYFEISAQLVYPNGERQPVRFSTAVDESTNVKIS